jgi:hypothetical protein
MRKLLSALRIRVLILAILALVAAPALAQVSPKVVPADSVFGVKSPLKYHVIRCPIAVTTANITGQLCGALPPGGAALKDVVIVQSAAGVGGTSWVATPKRATVALTSTNGGFTLAAGASKAINTAKSPMGAMAAVTGGTRAVITGDVAASDTITIAADLAADEKVTIAGVDITAKASGATNCQFNLGANEGANATALAAAINACTTYPVKQLVTATVADAVVTVTARTPGAAGNAITLTKTGDHITLGGSGVLAGGFSAMGTGGEIVTLDVTLTGTYSTGLTGSVDLYFLPRF